MKTTEYRDILYQKDADSGIVILTLNRPERKNALSFYSFYEIHQAVEMMEKDETVGAMIITGAIDPNRHDPQKEAFSSGGYFNPDALTAIPPEILEQIDMTDIAQKKLTLKMFTCEKPIIAAINGLAIGGAFTMALSGCDLIYMSEYAWFQLPFVRLGIVAELASSYLLPRLLGLQRAKELVYFGRKVSAQTAVDWGLVNAVVPHDRLMPFAREQALQLVPPGGPAFAIKRMKRTFHRPYIEALNQALDLENEGLNDCFKTADFAEALTARIEKRDPRFTGR
jgi:enoyl-CoA hydratase/carnithine racemase